ncbi:MAG: hypothetical protein LBS87_03315 [Puniceicoccales bacterium]|jgi:hypothetical protein|nr:hypothetical protein [Puniceicoccales bacterium]
MLVMSALAVSFLHIVESEFTYINQINPCLNFQLKKDSVLSIAITYLYSYLAEGQSLDECRQKIERCIGDNFDADVRFLLAPEDNKIPLRPEFLALFRQLFFAMELDSQDAKSLLCELEELFSAKKQGPSKLECLFGLPTFRRVFVDENGFLTEKWRIFAKNATCQGTDAVALCELSDELLNAVCTLEGWNLDDAKAALQSASFFSKDSPNDIFGELYSRGCSVHHPGLFKGKSSRFNLAITVKTGDIKLMENYIIKYNFLHNWCGFPFEIISQTSKF